MNDNINIVLDDYKKSNDSLIIVLLHRYYLFWNDVKYNISVDWHYENFYFSSNDFNCVLLDLKVSNYDLYSRLFISYKELLSMVRKYTKLMKLIEDLNVSSI